jgi:enoyl-CoA hydratase
VTRPVDVVATRAAAVTVVARHDEHAMATLTLTRPPINVLDQSTLLALGATIDRVAADPGVRVVVLASGVTGVFCAGGDLKFWRGFSREMARSVSRGGREVFERIENLPQPTIAAIEGHVIGDGLALALAADLRIVSEDATFRVPEAEYGFIPGWGIVRRLREQFGAPLALEMVLTGAAITAERALALGLVTEIVPSGWALRRAQELGETLARKSPAALTWSKRAVRGRPSVGNGDTWDEDCFAEVWGGEDWREGIDALLARRQPVFGERAAVRGDGS